MDKAEPLAARREAALIALTLKQLDGDCRELLRDYAPVLVTVKVPKVKAARNRRPGLLRPDYSEKSQSRRTSASSAGVKVDVTLAPGLQVKDPSKEGEEVGDSTGMPNPPLQIWKDVIHDPNLPKMVDSRSMRESR